MKGTKYLSDLVDVNLLRKDLLNVIYAPTGSGKTYFALNKIPKLITNPYRDVYHCIVYLIDTINGKEQILQNYKTVSATYYWAKEVDENGIWYK